MGNDGFDLSDDDVHDHVIEQLIGKNWGELEILEHYGYLLFPETLYKRSKSGEFEKQPIVLRVPRQHELREARVEARRIAKDDGLDPSLDKDLIDDIETVCILSKAIRNCTPPHEPWEPDPRGLEKRYDRGSLIQLWAKLDALHQVVDPAPHKIGEEEMFALIAAIAKERNILPLAVYGPAAQASFVIFMASLLQSSLESRSSSESSEHSTPRSSQSSGS